MRIEHHCNICLEEEELKTESLFTSNEQDERNMHLPMFDSGLGYVEEGATVHSKVVHNQLLELAMILLYSCLS